MSTAGDLETSRSICQKTRLLDIDMSLLPSTQVPIYLVPSDHHRYSRSEYQRMSLFALPRPSTICGGVSTCLVPYRVPPPCGLVIFFIMLYRVRLAGKSNEASVQPQKEGPLPVNPTMTQVDRQLPVESASRRILRRWLRAFTEAASRYLSTSTPSHS